MIAWYWGLVNALLVTLVIWANGRGYRWGWLAGAGAQGWIMLFGIAHGAWTFVFSLIPLVMFLSNWFWHHARREIQRAEHFEEFTERVHRANLNARIMAAFDATATEYGHRKDES